MKRNQKRVLGLFGLVLVAAMTCFAASLPGPNVAAVSSITDTIIVRVKGTTPYVQVQAPKNNTVFLKPEQTIRVYRENVDTVELKLTYTNSSGVEVTETIATFSPAQQDGEDSVDINLNNYGGFGDYLLTVIGSSTDGDYQEYVKFSYKPTTVGITESSEDGLPYIVVDYDDTVISKIVSYVYYGDEQITPPSPIIISSPAKKALLDLSGRPDGVYTIKSFVYDLGGNLIDGISFVGTYERKTTPVPDTGGLFKNLNISKEDSLITGLIAFFGFAMISLWILLKGKKDNKRRR